MEMYKISKSEWGKVEERFERLSKQLRQDKVSENFAWERIVYDVTN